jgi:hypothetical protein
MVNIMPIWPILGVEAAASCPKKVNHHQKKKEWLRESSSCTCCGKHLHRQRRGVE